MRVRVGTPARVGDADGGERFDRLGACLALARPVVGAVDIGDLVADLDQRVERGAGVLDDQADLAAADPAQLVVARVEQALALVAHRALGDPPGRADEADHGERCRRLARARLADEADELTFGDREREVLDGDQVVRTPVE